MASPEQFSRNMGRVGNNVAVNADRLVRRVAVAAVQVIIVATPVLSGRARSNWLASTDVTRDDQVEPLAEGAGATQPAINAATAIISTYDGDVNRDVRLANNVPYIEPLNNGSSAQAPAGFVRLGLQTAADAVDGARLLPAGGG